MNKTLMVVAMLFIATASYAQTDSTGQAVWFGNNKYGARELRGPAVRTGFRTYVSPRAFVRTDVMTSVNRDGISHLSWSGGAGVESSPVRAPQPRDEARGMRAAKGRADWRGGGRRHLIWAC